MASYVSSKNITTLARKKKDDAGNLIARYGARVYLRRIFTLQCLPSCTNYTFLFYSARRINAAKLDFFASIVTKYCEFIDYNTRVIRFTSGW